MKYKIHKAVVIGAGTMGAGIAALLVNAGVPVTLLDIVPRELTPEEQQKGLTLADRLVRNRIVQQGLDRVAKSRPASFFTPELAAQVKVGNLEDDFHVVGEADWVIEAIIENLKIKRQLMERIDAVRAPHTIISTNTSGIPVASIADGRSDGFCQHFLGTHFFNPPRYMKLLEIIPTDSTLPAVLETMVHFSELRLGKGVVLAKDTPNFIANRILTVDGAFGHNYILENDYTIEEVDAITGPAMGHPKTATFRLLDLVGIDVMEHVGGNLAELIPHDERAQRYLKAEPSKKLIRTMVERGWLGLKARQGFYKEVKVNGGKEFWPLNLKTMEYEAPTKIRFPSLGKVKDLPTVGEKLKVFIEADDRAAQLVRALIFHSMAYSSSVIPEIADTPKEIDDAMRWGFSHEAGPFESWDMLGVADTLTRIRDAGFEPAEWVDEMLASGNTTFYLYDGDRKIGVYNPVLRRYQPISRPPGLIILKEEKDAGKVIAKNPGATLIDIGDGVGCVELHTKMNALDDDIFNMIVKGLELAETELEGLVISTQGDNFSAGANLFMVVMGAQGGMWDQIETAIDKMQQMNLRMRYFPRPVVVAPAGLALGGGAEIIMHASRVVAASELYAGLVEIGAGVIPAGGGTKELLRRILNPAMRTKNVDPLPFLQRIFEQIGFAKVGTSAEEVRQLGILSPVDRVTLNRDLLISEAKKEVLHMAATGYQPPAREQIYASGEAAQAAMKVAVHMMKEGGYVTEHESLIAGKLSSIMTGGALTSPTWVDEQYILDLEREAFLSLCGTEKTQQRMWNILQTGKPLRN